MFGIAERLLSKAADLKALAEHEADLFLLDGAGEHREAAQMFSVAELVLRLVAEAFGEAA